MVMASTSACKDCHATFVIPRHSTIDALLVQYFLCLFCNFLGSSEHKAYVILVVCIALFVAMIFR
jgi:hypothetical protein